MSDGLLAPGRRALTIGIVMTVTLVAFEALAVITILPVVAGDLGGVRLYGWVTSAFFLGTLLGIVIAGDQADRRGPALPFVGGAVLFGAGLAIGGLAPSMLVLVLARGLQGVGGGAIPAVVYASVSRCYPEALRPRLFAITSTAWVVPGLLGPGLSAVIAERVGWRVVLLGLLPLVVLAVGLTVPTLRRIGPPPPQAATEHPLRLALRVTAGAGLVLAGLTTGAPLAGAALVAAGAVIGAPALVRLLPAGSLRARPGLPAAVLSKGLLTFAFFGADTYVPLAITSVGGYSPTVGGLAVTAATLSWTAASWVQERVATIATGRRLVVIGLLTVAAGIAATLVSLLPGAPAWVAVAAWGVGGFGVGLAYTPIALIVLKEAPPGQEGSTSASMQLTENLGVALGAGVGGALVAAADAGGWSPRAGLTAVFTLTGTAALLSIIVARRLPATTVPAREPGSPASQPGR